MLTKLQALPQIFEQFPELFLKLEEFFPESQKVAIAVSGGSDSMFLSFVIFSFWTEKKRNLNQLFFLHCNHDIRKESTQEAEFLRSFFADQQFQVFLRQDEEDQREEVLRLRRYGKFRDFLNQNKLENLLLGHNLNDRIESTFLNLIRGCGLKGLIAMQEREQHYLLDGKQVLRPLLTLPKAQIEAFCQDFGIPFFQDQSNFDPKISRRNLIRTQIFEPLLQIGEANQFLESRNRVYTALESQPQSSILTQSKGNPYVAETMFSFEPAEEEKKLKSQILSAFSQLNLLIKKGEVETLIKWLLQGESGMRKVQGWTLIFSHGRLYFLQVEEEKRNQELHLEREIDEGGSQTFGFFSLEIPEDLIGAKLRFPRKGDRFRGKSLSKRAINQKIPIFRRNALPLAERGGKIIFVWTPAMLGF